MAAETKYAEDAAHKAAEASGGLPQLDFSTWSSQIFWLVVTFGLLYFVLSQFILPRIGQGINERSDRIADDLDSASRMQQEAEQAVIEYERTMSKAKAKAHNIAEATRKSIDADIAKEVEAAEADFAAKQSVADERIAKKRADALSQIDKVAQDTTAAIVQKLGNIKPTAAQLKKALGAVKG